MLDTILAVAGSTDYDFRQTAEPSDPLSHLFDEWVPYYRTKWAVARVLRPQRILEIGVRFGYSALAFLHAAPSARYVGIDNDSETFGGRRGAASIARARLRTYKADVIIADSLQYESFPGERYDFIHVDGRQDERGTLHDVEVALRQGHYVLIDRYFWTRDNFLNVSEFLFCFRDLIRWYGVIPGYAGDLLVEAHPDAERTSTKRAPSSKDLRSAYTSIYYLCDCGGFDAFKRSGGKMLDARLQAMWELAQVAPPGRALDIGCGRGELSIALASDGRQVTAIDYSESAIDLAREAAANVGLLENIDFLCADASSAVLSQGYTLAVAGDVIEHMAPAELEMLYAVIARALTPDGIFVVHTFPNLWFYRYEHARKVRIAKSIGAYLPSNPRSRFERLMHINEQSPRVLLKQLRAHFGYVEIWFSDHGCGNPADNLGRRYSIAEMRAAGDLFAVASHSPVSRESLRRALVMEPLTAEQACQTRLAVISVPAACPSGQTFEAVVVVFNETGGFLNSRPPNPVRLSYHWIDADSGDCCVFDGRRTDIQSGVSSSATAHIQVDAPASKGRHILRLTLVQEFVRWFDQPPIGVFADADVTVT